MALKDVWKALTGKTDSQELRKEEQSENEIDCSDLFPVVRSSDIDISQYKKIPLSGIAALGSAFSQLPVAARTIVQTTTKTIATDETLFRAINYKGIDGFLKANAFGTTGNIFQINEQGKQIIAGRMRFAPVDGLPIFETSTTITPFNPTLMVVAVALITIEQKLDGIQKSVEQILQFLKREKQARQRGSLNMLSEIIEEYKQNCGNDKLCALRSGEVQTIKRESMQDIWFYQDQITEDLKKQKALHGSREAQVLLDSVAYAFAEYQLACYIYAFSSFLDILLQKNFDSSTVESAIKNMTDLGKRYNDLYADCHSQIAQYQQTSIETQLVGNVGIAAKSIGKAISTVPFLKEGPVDEALIGVGDSIEKFNKKSVQKKLKLFESFESSKMEAFIENLGTVASLRHNPNSLLTDGENLYIFSTNNHSQN